VVEEKPHLIEQDHEGVYPLASNIVKVKSILQPHAMLKIKGHLRAHTLRGHPIDIMPNFGLDLSFGGEEITRGI